MRTLTRLAFAAVILTAAVSAKAGTVHGHFRSNGTYVAPYYRTPANGTPYDNLSYRGYPSQQPGYVSPRSYVFDSGLARPTPLPGYGNYKLETMPRHFTGGLASQQLGYVSPRSYDYGSSAACFPTPTTISGTTTWFGNSVYYNYQSSNGGFLNGTTTTFGNSSFTSLFGW